jgi:signal transduction histidine kinase/phage shock protein PspC (stress-responsive transcriptional regulator)
MMGNVEDPAPWQRDRDPFGHWHHGPFGHSRRGPFWLRHRGDGGPLRRDRTDRLVGGVAAGLAQRSGFSVNVVRVVFVLGAIFTGGFGVPLYVAGWLLIPAAGEDGSIASRARSDSSGIALAAGLATLFGFILFVAGVFNEGWPSGWAWPQVFTVAGLTLIWRNASPDEQATLRRVVEPLSAAASPQGANRRSAIRLAIAGLLIFGGAGWVASAHKSVALLRPLGGAGLVIVGLVLLLAPWWLRIGRDVVQERQAKVRAQERLEIASRIHDSVLQTLALIQRQADDPQKVVWLARMQERELRSWLFEGRSPDEEGATLTAGIRKIQEDVESRYGITVEAVTVGDCELDANLTALLAAAGEATVNAAKWSGASVISLFAEVEPDSVSLVVRDRGKGFDPSLVSVDRKGLAESVHGRMTRHGGTAVVTSAVGEGTKVSLRMPVDRSHSGGPS